MKRIVLSVLFSFYFFSNFAQLHQAVSYTFDDNNPILSGTNIYEARDFITCNPHSSYVASPGQSLTARINPFLLFPPPGDSLGGPSQGENGQVGTLSSIIDVTPTGALNYSIPIDIPSGLNGMQPSLSLIYSNQGPNGIFGLGWSLSGLSSITRTGANLYDDGYLQEMNFSDNDKLSLDGNRLLTDGTYFSSGTDYYTEIETFSKIESIDGTNGDPGSFKVWTKDGRILYYGSTTDSRIVPENINKAYTWLLSRVEDRKGNYITYSYFNDIHAGIFYINKIEYTGNSTVSPAISPFYSIKFIPEQITGGRKDANDCYFSSDKDHWGKSTVQDRIEYIEIDYNTTLYKKYHLEYKDDLYSHLTKVTLITTSNSTLNPTVFEWGPTTNTINTYQSFDHSSNYDYYFSDYNGDGLTDYCRIPKNLSSTSTADFFFENANGVYPSVPSAQLNLNATFYKLYPNSPFSYTDCNFSSGNFDFDGDGANDIVLVNSSFENLGGQNTEILSYIPMAYNRSTNSFIPCPNLEIDVIKSHNPVILIGDFNGDGRDDLFLYDPTDHTYSLVGVNLSVINVDYNIPVETIRGTGDFKGDGKDDIMLTTTENYTLILEFDNISQTFQVIYNDYFPKNEHKIFIGDFNGDGKMDFVSYLPGPNGDPWKINFSTGNGFISKTFNNPYTCEPNVDLDDCHYFVGDFNGDGKSDLCFIYAAESNDSPPQLQTWVQYFLSDGTDLVMQPPFLYSTTTIPANHPNYIYDYYLGDFDGDGQTDIMHLYHDPGTSTDIIEYDQNTQKHMIHNVTNAFGEVKQFHYSTLSDKNIYTGYDNNHLPVYPIMELRKSLKVVSEISDENGNGGWLDHYYNYKQSNINLIAKGGFLCFNEISRNNAQENTLEISNYSFDNSSTNRTYYPYQSSKSLTYTNGSYPLITLTEYQYNIFHYSGNNGNIHIFPYLSKSFQKNYDIISGNGVFINSILNIYEYNSSNNTQYGNPSDQRQLSTNNASLTIASNESDFDSKTESVFTSYDLSTQNINLWLISQLQNKTVSFSSKNGSSWDNITHNYAYNYYLYGENSFPLLKTETKDISQNLGTSTSYFYDSFGNLIQKTLTAPNETTNKPNDRTIIYTYDQTDPQYQFDQRFITKITNSLNQSNFISYVPLTGNVKYKKDLSGLQTTFYFNDLKTDQKITHPDGNQTESVLRWLPSPPSDLPNALYYKWDCASGSAPEKTYYDKYQREIRKETQSFNGQTLFVDKFYDNLRNPLKVSDPYISGVETPQYTFSYFDYIHRLVTVVNTDNSSLTYGYAGPIHSITNSKGQTSSTSLNSAGWIIKSTDPNLTSIIYEYYPDGKVKNTYLDLTGLTDKTKIHNEYDLNGNCIQIIDPDLGTITYNFDAFGDMLSKTDNKQQNTTCLYDDLGRLTSMNEVEGRTNWVYDTKIIGEISTISNPVENIEYNYDGFSREIEKIQKINGETFTSSKNYDEFGRVKETIYPNANTSIISIKNKYADNGDLQKISTTINSTEIPLWEIINENSINQITQFKLGDNINCTFGFDNASHKLTSIQTTGPNSSILQDLEYSWDIIGNLKYRKKWITRSPQVALKEQFADPTNGYDYDNRNRLTTTKLNGQNVDSYTYDDMGNILTKPPLSNINYGIADPLNNSYPGIHAITSANIQTNSIPTDNQVLTFTSFDKVSKITQGNKELDLIYGLDHERIKQTYDVGGSFISSKEYIGNGLIEKVTDANGTKYLNYIYGPSGIFAIITTQEGRPSVINYILKDHIGSYNCITDKDGNLLEELSFDAWGNRRNSTDWTYNNVPTTFIFDRGFTGHEHLDQFGLINMNGRLYDPINSRFLSPDRFIQKGDYSQNLNRYSYCLNNPLTYNDPTGNCWFLSAIIGFVTNYITTGITTEHWGWEAIESGLIGAASGLVGYSAGMVGNSFASQTLGLSSSASGLVGSMVGGATSGAFSSLLTGQNTGRGAAIGTGGALIGAVTSNLDINNLFEEGAVNIVAGGVYGGYVSESMGGSFANGFKTGAISSAVGWGVDRGMQYIADKVQRNEAMKAAENLLNADKTFKNQQLKSCWDKEDTHHAAEVDNVTETWEELKALWLKTYGTDQNLQISNNFDLTGDAMKFNNLHIRLDLQNNQILYHYDSFDIVKFPIVHIMIDCLYQGFRFFPNF
jgi:RHS repeat-associated protein